MTSLLTNTSAMRAVSALAVTQRALAATESQITTGLRVSSAKDNAAYWSIATSMKTRIGELGALDDGLDVTKGIIGTTNAALTTILGLTQGIAKDVVTAQTSGVDLDKVQLDIAAKPQQIVAAAQAATYNGTNWLVTEVTGTSIFSLVDDYGSTSAGRNSAYPYNFLQTVHQVDTTTSTLGTSTSSQVTTTDLSNGFTDNNGTPLGESNFVNTSSTSTTGDATGYQRFQLALGINDDGSLAATTVDLHNTALFQSLQGTVTSSYVEHYSDVSFPSGTSTTGTTTPFLGSGANYASDILDTPSYDLGGTHLFMGTSVLTFNVRSLVGTSLQDDAFKGLTALVNGAIAGLTSAQSYMGGLEDEIDGTQALNKSIIDALTSGVGSLVDADMNEASTRLNALQTQQQLGVQALGIANDNSSIVLKLFGN